MEITFYKLLQSDKNDATDGEQMWNRGGGQWKANKKQKKKTKSCIIVLIAVVWTHMYLRKRLRTSFFWQTCKQPSNFK